MNYCYGIHTFNLMTKDYQVAKKQTFPLEEVVLLSKLIFSLRIKAANHFILCGLQMKVIFNSVASAD
jgi:hypothetical protein